MKRTVPFYPQKWDVTQWKEMGFKDLRDAVYWEESSCGVLSLKMAIDSFLMEKKLPVSPAISEYIKTGMEIHAYSDEKGWFHEGLVDIAHKFGFSASTKKITNLSQIKTILDQGNLLIVSVRVAFKDKRTLRQRLQFWKSFGGHLALVVGSEIEGKELKGFYVHHTSTVQENNWQYAFFPLKKFKEGFTGRAIIINPMPPSTILQTS